MKVSDIVQGWKDRFPSGGTSLEFTEPLPDVYKNLIAVTEQGGLIRACSIAARARPAWGRSSG